MCLDQGHNTAPGSQVKHSTTELLWVSEWLLPDDKDCVVDTDWMVNCVNPDQTALQELSDLGEHCYLKSL